MKYYGSGRGSSYIYKKFGVAYNDAHEALDASEASKAEEITEDGVTYIFKQWSEDDLNRIGQELASR